MLCRRYVLFVDGLLLGLDAAQQSELVAVTSATADGYQAIDEVSTLTAPLIAYTFFL